MRLRNLFTLIILALACSGEVYAICYPFDRARSTEYSHTQIVDHLMSALSTNHRFDFLAARKAGVTDSQIVGLINRNYDDRWCSDKPVTAKEIELDGNSANRKLNLTTETSKVVAEWNSGIDECRVRINFTGEISAQDIAIFRKVLDVSCTETKKNLNQESYITYDVSLDSKGGDVDAALAIGRLLRNAKFPVKDLSVYTRVEHERHCYSACVFILAAGMTRSVSVLRGNAVGIHRPYFAKLDAKYSTTEIRQIRSMQNKAIREYLLEMDLAESLLDAMLAVPPDEIKLLTEAELKQFRLNLPDANFEERGIARMASWWYLTSSEYRLRNAQVRDKCNFWPPRPYDPEWSEVCEATIMLRISAEEYSRRRIKWSECSPLFNTHRFLECMMRIRAGK
jgi:hypothetical protein